MAEKQNGRYGFKHNLHQKPSETITRVEFIEKHINSTYAVTGKKLIISSIIAGVLLIGSLMFLTSNLVRTEYIVVPYIVIIIGVIILVGQFMFIDPSSGSLISGSIRLVYSILDSIRVKLGKKKRFKGTEILKIRRDGIAKYRDGGYGMVFNLDGATSQTAFPEEIRAQEGLSINYQNARDISVAEIKVTSSQPQNTERQRKNMERQMRNNAKSKGIYDIISQQKLFVSKYVEGVKPTVVQYLILKAPTIVSLERASQRLVDYTNRGLYYSVKLLNEKEASEILSDIYALK